jgi:LysM repeat protein
MTRRRNIPLSLVGILFLAASLILPLRLASAAPNAITANEVMALVNELRRSQGLEPYSIDPAITAYAQEHSEYQAQTDTSTHLHSDGLTSLSHGYVENVAGGTIGYLTAQAVVYEIWNDPVHMKTMVGYASGSAGVGVASNSTTTFVTLNVRPGDAVIKPRGTSGSVLVGTPIALVPLRTATMKPSGAVVHEVGYGQSLWAIAMAYGVSSARIRELNGMAPDDSSIYAGQWLLIVPAGLVTPTPPEADPAAAATSTASSQTPTRISPTPGLTSTPIQTMTATPTPPNIGLASRIKIDPIIAGLAGLAVLGLILVLSSGIKVNRRY